MASRIATLTLVLAIGAGLAACAPAQTQDQACDIFTSADLSLVDAITNSSGSLIDDPLTARDDLDAAVTTFENDVSPITHPRVKTAVDAMTVSLKDFNDQFADAAANAAENPDSVDDAALSASLTAAENAEAEVAAVCNS